MREDGVVAAQLLYVVEMVGVAADAPPRAIDLLVEDSRAEVLLRLDPFLQEMHEKLKGSS